MGMKKVKVIHASRLGTKRPLCAKVQGKVTDDPTLVTCTGCGRAAQRIVALLEEAEATAHAASLHGRQEAALAAAQPPRWWEGKTRG